MIGLAEKGVLTCEAVGTNSKVPESRDEVLEGSVIVLGVCSVVNGVKSAVVLLLGLNRPEESRACFLVVRSASVSVILSLVPCRFLCLLPLSVVRYPLSVYCLSKVKFDPLSSPDGVVYK